MGLFSSILGHASEVDADKMEREFEGLLIPGESIQCAFHLFRDLTVFTNHRFFLVDKQGLTGRKREYVCIPYKSIDYFSIETAGNFDLDSEIKIWVKSRETPIEIEFKRGGNILEVFRALSANCLT